MSICNDTDNKASANCQNTINHSLMLRRGPIKKACYLQIFADVLQYLLYILDGRNLILDKATSMAGTGI